MKPIRIEAAFQMSREGTMSCDSLPPAAQNGEQPNFVVRWL